MSSFKLNEPAPERFAADVLTIRNSDAATRKAVCRVLGFTQVSLAAETGVGITAICNWLNNNRKTRDSVRGKIGNALLLRYIQTYEPKAQDKFPPFDTL